MSIKTFISSIFYLLIWISLWGFVETIIESITNNNSTYKIGIYFSIFIVSTLLYVFAFDNVLSFQQIRNLDDNKKLKVI